eukprot:Lankesteria_metandrocarpae@DN1181_c0_g1_i1.p1
MSRSPYPAVAVGSGAVPAATAVEATGGWRNGDRGQNEIRRLFFRTGFLHKASGSAHASLGNTKVQCAVHGPVQGDGMELKLELKVADFARAHHLQSTALSDQHLLVQVSQAIESVLRKTSGMNYGLQINIVIVEDDGGLLPCTLNCVGLALANAGVEMVGIMAAVNVYAISFADAQRYWKSLEKADVALLGQEEEVVCMLDMDADEMQFFESAGGLTQLTLALCPTLEAVCVLEGRGVYLSDTSGDNLLALATAGCHAVGTEVSRCLAEGFVGSEVKAEIANERRIAIQAQFFCDADVDAEITS